MQYGARGGVTRAGTEMRAVGVQNETTGGGLIKQAFFDKL
jgi:hypothetical protein